MMCCFSEQSIIAENLSSFFLFSSSSFLFCFVVVVVVGYIYICFVRDRRVSLTLKQSFSQ